MNGRDPDTPRPLRFRAAQRLSRAGDYQATFKAGVRKSRGPLLVFARPNGLDRSRMGLSVPRRVGGAVRRNAVKRRVREAFRELRAELPSGYDLVVCVRAHEVTKTGEYADWLASAAKACDKEWVKRVRKRGDP